MTACEQTNDLTSPAAGFAPSAQQATVASPGQRYAPSSGSRSLTALGLSGSPAPRGSKEGVITVPVIHIYTPEGFLSPARKKLMVERVTAAAVDAEGLPTRDLTYVLVHEVADGGWGWQGGVISREQFSPLLPDDLEPGAHSRHQPRPESHDDLDQTEDRSESRLGTRSDSLVESTPQRTYLRTGPHGILRRALAAGGRMRP